MKKSLLTIVSLILLLTFTSASSSITIDGKIGGTAPNFGLSNENSSLSLQQLKGKYVLLSFWSSSDANSRISNIKYDQFAKSANNAITLIAVNYDRNSIIYQEIINRDKLQKSSQFYDQEGTKSRIFKSYHLDQGYKSYLINPAGEIIAENPGTSQLALLISQ